MMPTRDTLGIASDYVAKTGAGYDAISLRFGKNIADELFMRPVVAKFNQYHDEKGKFTSKSGASMPANKYAKGASKETIEVANASKEKLTPKERKTVSMYTGTEYNSINGGLREGKVTGSTKKYVKRLDSAMRKFQVVSPMRVYRGGKITIPEGVTDKKQLIGMLVTDRAFVSTTTNKNLAKKWGNKTKIANEKLVPGGKPGCLFKILLPAGFHAIDVENTGLTWHGNENEFILPRDSVFRIKSVKNSSGALKITLEAVYDGASSTKKSKTKQ